MSSRFLRSLLILSITSLVVACGGGGGGNSISSPVVNPPPSSTATITGTVPVPQVSTTADTVGAHVTAVDKGGNIVAIAKVLGKKEVDQQGIEADTKTVYKQSVQASADDASDAQPFALTGIPFNEDIRIFVVTGGDIYPLYFDANRDGVSDSNVFSLASGLSGGELALGFIDLDKEPGRAIPSNNPIDNPSFTAKGEIVAIPPGVNQPPTAGFSVTQLNSEGQDALDSGWILGARTYYQAAATLAGDNLGNDADTARFMLALTQVAALGYDTLSDGNAQDMGRLGDMLDLFGFANDETRANWSLLEEPDPLPGNSPTGNDVRNYSYDVVRPVLQAAADNFDRVSMAFDAVFTNEFGNLYEAFGGAEIAADSDEKFNADYGDARFFSGLLRSVIANIEIERAYNLNVDIDDIKNNNRQVEDVLAGDSTLLGTPDSTKLAEAKASLNSALSRLSSAIDSIGQETDDQTDDFITLDESQDPVELQTWISETQSSIAGSTTNIGKVSVDLRSFFDNGVVLDETTIPVYTGNDLVNYPEPTFGNVILDTDTEEPGIQTLND